MEQNEDVLAANEAFYDAFAAGDMEAMSTIWAKEADVTCLHPGWNPIFGRQEVLDSWQRIISSPDRPQIECVDAKADVSGISGKVICYEKIGGGYLIATNFFVLEDGAWRMTHHHASGLAPSSTLS